MKGAGALQVDLGMPAAYKTLRCEKGWLVSAELLCVRERSCWEISPCPSASDSSLYFPARAVHHPPPPASPTIPQFLTS